MIIRKYKRTLPFILKYNDYISKIYESSSDDDLYIYNYSNDVNKGMIWTIEVNKAIDIIKRKFSELHLVKAEDLTSVYIEGSFDVLSKYIPLFNNLGYFISKYTTDNDFWDHKTVNEHDKPLALYLEPKFDVEIVDIPKIMYHATYDKKKNKILKGGLFPKSNNKKSMHPDRIYITDDINVAKNFGEFLFKDSVYKDPFIILKIDTEKVDDMKMFRDVNLEANGFYTVTNIKPGTISII